MHVVTLPERKTLLMALVSLAGSPHVRTPVRTVGGFVPSWSSAAQSWSESPRAAPS